MWSTNTTRTILSAEGVLTLLKVSNRLHCETVLLERITAAATAQYVLARIALVFDNSLVVVRLVGGSLRHY